MKEITISSFQKLHNAFETTRSWKTIFRGQNDALWRLVPAAGRLKGFADDGAFDYWLKKTAKHLTRLNFKNKLEQLAIAQHHGLPTRLLDWTTNPLAAAFFAVAGSDCKSHAAIYALELETTVGAEQLENPFDEDNVSVYRYDPPSIDDRIFAQHGVFTLHASPEVDVLEEFVESNNLVKYIISKEYINKLARELDGYGINYMTMYPDMDGASKYVLWHMDK